VTQVENPHTPDRKIEGTRAMVWQNAEADPDAVVEALGMAGPSSGEQLHPEPTAPSERSATSED
jgi:hypothetical protein